MGQFLRIALSLALAFQALAPNALAAFGPDRFDPASYLCAPSGDVSDEARAALEEFAALTAQDQQTHSGDPGDCHACVKGAGAVLPLPTVVAAPRHDIAFDAREGAGARVVYAAQGPPLGQRAPPLLH